MQAIYSNAQINPEKDTGVKAEQQDDDEGLGTAEVNEDDSDMKQAFSNAIQSAISHIKMQD